MKTPKRSRTCSQRPNPCCHPH